MPTQRATQRRIKHSYIVRQKGVCGGKPIIAGTRIRVSQIATYYEKMGYQPDDIVRMHPQLTLAQVHDALSYYYDHIEEIDRQIAEERRLIEEMKQGYVSVLEQKDGGNSHLR